MRTFVKVGCGCTVDVDHLSGARRVFCPGGGEVDGVGSVQPANRIKCEGGKPWVVTALNVVRYDVKPWGGA